jgi:putative phosphoesterase
MMFALLMSDTHGNLTNFRNVLSNYPDLDLVIHLGDCTKDVYKMQREFHNIPFEFVSGNNDWSSSEPNDKVLTLKGTKIMMTHGHKYAVKSSMNQLFQKATSLDVNAVFFGHTHLADEFTHQDILFINPGTLGANSVYQGCTFTELRIEDGKIQSKFKVLP